MSKLKNSTIQCNDFDCKIIRQYNHLQSTRYIFPQLDKTSDFKLDLAVLDDNPRPLLTRAVRSGMNHG